MTVDRRLLPVTFGPWFARFQGLTEVQVQAIPPIMEGRDVLICSATATGKTEAFAAPAAEFVRRHGDADGSGASVLIVVPTRALANDLKRRLEGPMGLVDVSFGRYTGEHKERVRGRLPAVVIVTPEALDSLLARRPSVLRATRLVVLDEIHVLDGTPRGDQLRVLLRRLELVTERRPQRVAASATVDRPEELGRRYLTDPALVVVPGIRRILGRPFTGRSAESMRAHLDDLAGHGFKKLLVFCRSRNQVETYGAKLRGRTRFDEAVFAHHGSLARAERERAERLFHQAPAAVCFATLTLELGIDIGTVDYVLLAGLPADVSSVLQRIGRGGRRGDTTRCGYAAEDATEDFLFRAMLRLAKEGRLCAAAYGFRPAVLVQQALVLACAEGYVRACDLERALPVDVAAELGAGACQALVECMVEAELLERAGGGRYVAAEAVELRYERGSLHSNIEDTAGVEVVDRITGDVVGSILRADTGKIEVAGRNRAVVKQADGRILTDAAAGAEPARFRSSAAPSVTFALGRAVVESIGVAPDALGVFTADGTTVLLHGLGTVGTLFLLDLWKPSLPRGSVEKSGAYTIVLTSPPPPLTDAVLAVQADEGAVEQFLERRSESVARLLGVGPAGPWKRGVPESLRRAAVRRMSGLDEVAAFLRGARLEALESLEPALASVIWDL